jgi:hypothetical protein
MRSVAANFFYFFYFFLKKGINILGLAYAVHNSGHNSGQMNEKRVNWNCPEVFSGPYGQYSEGSPIKDGVFYGFP